MLLESTLENQRTKMSIIKSYDLMSRLITFEERFNYLKLDGSVGMLTFGGHRYLNQEFYRSKRWKSIRRSVIIRDDGCDLGHMDHPIRGPIFIHHIEPITISDIINEKPKVFDLNNLVSVSFRTHNALHYGDDGYLNEVEVITRMPNDTIPWR